MLSTKVGALRNVVIRPLYVCLVHVFYAPISKTVGLVLTCATLL